MEYYVGDLTKRLLDNKYELRKKLYNELQKSGYWVDKIFEIADLNLIVGAPGAGKTTFMVQMIYDWITGKDIFGYKGIKLKGEEYLYVTCDRTLVSVEQILVRLGIDLWDFQVVSLDEIAREARKEAMDIKVEDFLTMFPKVKLFFMEPISMMIPQGNGGYQDTLRYWRNAIAKFREHDKGITGTMHSPKQKANDRYSNPRDQTIGSVGVPAIAGTIVVIQQENDKDPTNDCTIVSLLPRHERNQIFLYNRDEKGRFLLDRELTKEEILYRAEHGKMPSAKKESVKKVEATINEKCCRGDIVTAEYFKELFFRNDLSERLCYKWLEMKVRDGAIKKPGGKGMYQLVKLGRGKLTLVP